ncbi:hypothetical protein GXM_03438 [Nostoc sphaeroides CCNUC1]|uniref:Uncharacterized protein n=1 Tax=Nostoc sphaeroides CCNUC1 TaxID=2653204 RepID=A0A5P8W1R5_9NOSO|nr:hypothetical protein GXM_03438 [Nostoc sphaeroides CCNUC1]
MPSLPQARYVASCESVLSLTQAYRAIVIYSIKATAKTLNFIAN